MRSRITVAAEISWRIRKKVAWAALVSSYASVLLGSCYRWAKTSGTVSCQRKSDSCSKVRPRVGGETWSSTARVRFVARHGTVQYPDTVIAPRTPYQGVNSSRVHHHHKHKQSLRSHSSCSFIRQRPIFHILKNEKFFGLHDGGLTPLEIAIEFRWDKSTITHILQKYS